MSYLREGSNNRDPMAPRCTLVFDREAYSFAFSQLLWYQHRVAGITCRKASLFALKEENTNTGLDQTRKYMVPQLKLSEEIQSQKTRAGSA
jgi:hypothetical protein